MNIDIAESENVSVNETIVSSYKAKYYTWSIIKICGTRASTLTSLNFNDFNDTSNVTRIIEICLHSNLYF